MRELAEAEELLSKITSHAKAGTLFQWGIARREDDQVIGTATLFRVDPEHRRVRSAGILRRDQWGRGLAHEALTALLGHAFSMGGISTGWKADIDPRNARSIRSVERLGFKLEGTPARAVTSSAVTFRIR